MLSTHRIKELDSSSQLHNNFDQSLASFISSAKNPSFPSYHSDILQHHQQKQGQDFFDSLDIQSTPSLLSPNMSNKDISEDEDNMDSQLDPFDEQENYMTPLRMMKARASTISGNTLNESTTLLPQHLPSPPYSSSFNELVNLDSIYHQQNQFQSHQFQLFTQNTQPQQQYHFPANSVSPFESTSIPTHMTINSSSIQYVISSHEDPQQQQQLQQLELQHQHQQQQFQEQQIQEQQLQHQLQEQYLQQQLQELRLQQLQEQHRVDSSSTIQSTITPLEQNMDLLSTPSVRSPSLSWASISRDASPECTLSTFEDKEVAVRPYKRRLGSTLIRSPDISKAAASSSEMSTTETTGSSSTASARKRHVRQMKIKIKPTTFICESPGCGKKFSRAYNLTSHMKTHSTERPFTCGSCPLAFARRHDRERHMRLHTGEKPYSCKSCGAGFMRNDALHRHLKICGQSTAAIMALLHPQAERH